jgi:hypothetical protein
MKRILLITISSVIIFGCYEKSHLGNSSNYKYKMVTNKWNSQLYSDSLYEIRIVFTPISNRSISIYLIPKKNEMFFQDPCNAQIIEMDAKIIYFSDKSTRIEYFYNHSASYDSSTSPDKTIPDTVFSAVLIGHREYGEDAKLAYCSARLKNKRIGSKAIWQIDSIHYELKGVINLENYNKIINIEKYGSMVRQEYLGNYIEQSNP